MKSIAISGLALLALAATPAVAAPHQARKVKTSDESCGYGATKTVTMYRSSPTATAKAPSRSGSSSATGTAASSLSTSTGASSGNSTSSLNLPSGCLIKNNIAIGWLPDEDNGGTMPPITNALGAKACFYGLYAQVTSAAWDDSQLTSRMSDIKASGAILQASIMPTKVRFSQVDAALAGKIAATCKKFTDAGVPVWLRFAHEFNWYVADGTYAGGTPAEFVAMWQTLAAAVRANGMVKLYWSPNNAGADVGALQQWWPGAAAVDVVGLDVYPSPGASFGSAYGAFYDAFATAHAKPFYIAETGMTKDDGSKSAWLTQLVNPGGAFPLYGGVSWFEYNKAGEGDFRVVTGDRDLARPILG